MITVRIATDQDAQSMSRILTKILVAWASDRPRSPDHVCSFYINHPDRIRCSVAEDAEGRMLGFQSLKIARKGNPYEVTPGWGVIGTYVNGEAARMGIGRALFGATLAAAREGGLAHIDATIGSSNREALSYYDTMGFVTYKRLGRALCKRFDVPAEAG